MQGNADYSANLTNKRRKGVKISQLNIASLRKNKVEIAELMYEQQLDIFCLNETRLSNDIRDCEISVDGYSIYRHDRNTSGGGVAIYIKDTLSHHKRDNINIPNLEIIGIEITPKHAKSFIVLSWYRPPTEGTDVPTFETLRELMQKLDAEEKEIILVGDTNCDYKKPKDCNTRKLKLIYSEFQFEQFITDFTRVSTTKSSNGETNTSKTVINHFFTNRPNFISEYGIIKTGMSDHYMIYGIRKLNARLHLTRKQIKTEFRCMRDYDQGAFLLDLQSIDWEIATSTALDDPNVMTENFYGLFHSVLDVHAPLRKRNRITRHAPSPWITPRIKEQIRERDQAKKRAERDHSVWPEYKRLRNKVTGELRRSVENYYSNSIEENSSDPKMMWKTINKVLNKNRCSTTPSCVMYEGQLFEEKKKIAEAFNNHFTTIGPKLAEKI